MATATNNQQGGGSISDAITVLKNLVTGLATLAQNYLNVQGAINFAGLNQTTIVKSSAGRIARISVIVPGAATGFVYDSTSVSATTKPLYVIPMTVGVFEVNLPASFGIMIVPGAGMTVSGSFS
jgi:hypothetical protein